MSVWCEAHGMALCDRGVDNHTRLLKTLPQAILANWFSTNGSSNGARRSEGPLETGISIRLATIHPMEASFHALARCSYKDACICRLCDHSPRFSFIHAFALQCHHRSFFSYLRYSRLPNEAGTLHHQIFLPAIPTSSISLPAILALRYSP